MNILSLDLSTKSTGWAFFEDGQLMAHGCITASSTDLINRIEKIVKELKTVTTHFTPSKIVVEEVRPEGGYGVGNLKTHRALMWLQAAVAFWIHDEMPSVDIDYIYPSSWRASLGIKNGRGIKRMTLKEADVDFVKNKYGITVNDDEADAICIGLAQYMKQDNNEINWE